jgi:hypothetical protein
VLDTESSEFSHLWIPAFAGMTVFVLLTSSSDLYFENVWPANPPDGFQPPVIFTIGPTKDA